jgi:hypothetical protein
MRLAIVLLLSALAACASGAHVPATTWPAWICIHSGPGVGECVSGLDVARVEDCASADWQSPAGGGGVVTLHFRPDEPWPPRRWVFTQRRYFRTGEWNVPPPGANQLAYLRIGDEIASGGFDACTQHINPAWSSP